MSISAEVDGNPPHDGDTPVDRLARQVLSLVESSTESYRVEGRRCYSLVELWALRGHIDERRSVSTRRTGRPSRWRSRARPCLPAAPCGNQRRCRHVRVSFASPSSPHCLRPQNIRFGRRRSATSFRLGTRRLNSHRGFGSGIGRTNRADRAARQTAGATVVEHRCAAATESTRLARPLVPEGEARLRRQVSTRIHLQHSAASRTPAQSGRRRCRASGTDRRSPPTPEIRSPTHPASPATPR